MQSFDSNNSLVPVAELGEQNLGILPASSFAHLKSITCSSIVAEEVTEIASDCPVVLLRDEQSGKFQLTAILGLTPQHNLMLDQQGHWRGLYMPIGLEIAPFSFCLAEEENTRLRVDMSSPLVATNQGKPLFENGQKSAFLADMTHQLELVQDAMLQTEIFVEALVNRNLITECQLTLQLEGQQPQTEEFFTINTSELSYMANEDIIDFHRKGYWSPLFAIRNSLNQFKRLLNLHQTATSQKGSLSLQINQDQD
ncbi:SapC family protein [Neptunicella sp. SCSIO 80796]|uniref:SapC family protein n=1 Tax=Neptunicella plasticusilytica TaxID=3117012 RepID=UPI003A4DD7A0